MDARKMVYWLVLSTAGLVGWFARPVWGAETNVNIVDFAFNPSTVTIQTNDSVIWTWIGPTTHTSTSDTGLWDSGFLSASAAKFTNVFKASGSFPYHCAIHPFMTASVIVQGPTANPITLSSEQMVSPGSFAFAYSATPGLNYAVDRSLDLHNWTPLATNNAATTQVTFTDNAATGTALFYRVRLVSGP